MKRATSVAPSVHPPARHPRKTFDRARVPHRIQLPARHSPKPARRFVRRPCPPRGRLTPFWRWLFLRRQILRASLFLVTAGLTRGPMTVSPVRPLVGPRVKPADDRRRLLMDLDNLTRIARNCAFGGKRNNGMARIVVRPMRGAEAAPLDPCSSLFTRHTNPGDHACVLPRSFCPSLSR